jgi:hypothetical protein
MYFVMGNRDALLSNTKAEYALFEAYIFGREIDNATARTVASWWQSPGTVGKWLGMLAMTGTAPMPYLMDDINATRKEATTERDKRYLDQLATWACNHESLAVAKTHVYVHCDCCGMDVISRGITVINLCDECDDQCCRPRVTYRDGSYGTTRAIDCESGAECANWL